MDQFDQSKQAAKIRVVGVGGAGCNAVNTMISASLDRVDFIAANTDIQALAANHAQTRIQIGATLTKGLGAGANPEMGREAAVDTLITIPNQRLLSLSDQPMPLLETFKKADEVLLNAVQGISDLIQYHGYINVDFADVKTIMSDRGLALMGTGRASGDRRAMSAMQQAISSPLLEDVTIDGVTGLLINITGGRDMTLQEVNEALTLVHDAADPEAELLFGSPGRRARRGEVKIHHNP